MTVKTDVLNRYLFDGKHARGELVQLTKAYQEIIALHEYPPGVQALLGELVAATCLLTATLKFEGEITVQLQGDGPISYMSVNGDDKQNMRGIARLAEPTAGIGLKELIGKGTMVITIRPEKGEPYQGVVALDKDNLADCLAHYFEVSEQIPTKIWLFNNADNTQVAGSLIQLLPDSDSKETQLSDFEHLCQLTNTIKADEIFSLDAEDLLYRLYHQEEVRLFEPQSVNYQCSCSEEKCLTAISQVSPSELISIIEEQGCVSMTCEYCLTTYKFDEPKLAHFIHEPKH
ncbi:MULTISPECIES: Hsp33 family molecular chaperone HslO [unclassified Colwellia]|uniref:Hsp33 family molecular chaperone HslO n=1 Tax=unclassified Colwellia TaxID=196834 RepID=UPI0015F4C8B2|nr:MULTISPECIES: Hsp33 family molecular chaperone HslO [unclassified Colwellia]MBA6254217.1 Hsp33 family molecular chaperone HslO [Colwellia sp. MB3u-55]MBA6346870.1 Hsp33 family molecular chaperone HslO [Colwellia sp. BRX8-9]MBA6350518.1 Hsp33 family molecular chaperone HslO [Colwellia sp. BRX9-1]MBA6355393.1 Hsp33 family molecular chaperone HslO [Colwellia sp. BRX8-3]MBA6358739.1 Hsp33 family molecular chaperone HslO [Colwellia sp. BRX8-6]